ncbi:HD domain-containing phosphohydrolase [Salinicola endophyticus]|uniref:HD domain-containing phosphohydrolase n=1 Tax=Salinicola endophyticus TaxID=1949083 RepID=UPI000DA24D51|nr:HD domain-containing phosphohydrolase [Salinicola endophyticus]
MSTSASTDILNAKAKWEWLDPLCIQGSVNLAFDQGEESWPVLLDDIERDHALIIDISAVPALAEQLKRGDAFHLFGHVNGAMVRTSTLAVIEWLETDGDRLRVRCSYPELLSTVHRRNTFRAPIRAEMGVEARLVLEGHETPVAVELRNLSLGGCLLAMPLGRAVSLASGQRFAPLELHFPSLQSLRLSGSIRHVRSDEGWREALIGCEFDDPSLDKERLLWYCVKEAEREGARSVMTRDKVLSPSPLFRGPDGQRPAPKPAETTALAVGNATARRLKKIADYLSAQILTLQNGGAIASSLLSRHADTLVTLSGQGQDALLYALGYLHEETPLVRHSLGVAVRATDLVRWQGYPEDVIKAVAASALVHDLGKCQLPASILDSREPLDAEARARLAEHVPAVLTQLEHCRWLAPEIARAIVGEANERLDGSGYPAALGDAQLSPLGRMMAVVDVIDALGQPRADRDAWPLLERYRHVLGHPALFDATWAQRYVRRFGTAPVGSLARFSSGALAWVQRIDDQGRPAQVHLVLNTKSPQRRLDQILNDGDIAQLGKFEGVLPEASYGLHLS